jgi:hypothetical protein
MCRVPSLACCVAARCPRCLSPAGASSDPKHVVEPKSWTEISQRCAGTGSADPPSRAQSALTTADCVIR